jgi:hypothetical protein
MEAGARRKERLRAKPSTLAHREAKHISHNEQAGSRLGDHGSIPPWGTMK